MWIWVKARSGVIQQEGVTTRRRPSDVPRQRCRSFAPSGIMWRPPARPPARLPPASAYCTFVFVCQAWRLHPRSAKLLICTSLCKLMSSRAQLKKQSASRFFCGKPCWRVNGRLLPVDSCQLCLLISINVCRIFSQWAPHPWFYLSVSFWFHVTSLIS